MQFKFLNEQGNLQTQNAIKAQPAWGKHMPWRGWCWRRGLHASTCLACSERPWEEPPRKRAQQSAILKHRPAFSGLGEQARSVGEALTLVSCDNKKGGKELKLCGTAPGKVRGGLRC